jgi:hypothetical protein
VSSPPPGGLSYGGLSYGGLSYGGLSYGGLSYGGLSYGGLSYGPTWTGRWRDGEAEQSGQFRNESRGVARRGEELGGGVGRQSGRLHRPAHRGLDHGIEEVDPRGLGHRGGHGGPGGVGQADGQVGRHPRRGFGGACRHTQSIGDAAVVESGDDAGQPRLTEGRHPRVQGFAQRADELARLLVQGDGGRAGHDRAHLAQGSLTTGGAQGHGTVLPGGQTHSGLELLGHGEKRLG